MRDELHLMELVDRYLDGTLGAEEQAAFEARMGANAELRAVVDDHRALREGLARVPVRAAIGSAHRAWKWGKWAPKIGGFVVVAGVATAVLLATHKPAHRNDERNVPIPSDSLPDLPRAKALADSLRAGTPADTACASYVVHVDTVVQYVYDTIGRPPLKGSVTEEEQDHARASALVRDARGQAPIAVQAADVQPRYPGGFDAMYEFLKNNIRYPENVTVNGTVMITFIVDEKGKVRSAYVSKALDPACDAEALRVIKAMPDWIPGRQKGVPVKCQVEVPLQFNWHAQATEQLERPLKF